MTCRTGFSLSPLCGSWQIELRSAGLVESYLYPPSCWPLLGQFYMNVLTMENLGKESVQIGMGGKKHTWDLCIQKASGTQRNKTLEPVSEFRGTVTVGCKTKSTRLLYLSRDHLKMELRKPSRLQQHLKESPPSMSGGVNRVCVQRLFRNKGNQD